MNPWDCTIGREVEYAPSPGRWFRGIVDAVPWKLGDVTYVTVLRNMPPEYAEFTGKKGNKATTVYAAALCCLRPVKPESE